MHAQRVGDLIYVAEVSHVAVQVDLPLRRERLDDFQTGKPGA
jgi:hypothetical protein